MVQGPILMVPAMGSQYCAERRKYARGRGAGLQRVYYTGTPAGEEDELEPFALGDDGDDGDGAGAGPEEAGLGTGAGIGTQTTILTTAMATPPAIAQFEYPADRWRTPLEHDEDNPWAR